MSNQKKEMNRLAKSVIKQARNSGLSIVTAESCTAGAIAKVLSEVPGAGTQLEGGFVTYTKEMKHKTLGVPKTLLKKKSAVCAQVAEALARGALKASPADVAAAVTGVAGPKQDDDGNPVGLVYCCVLKRGSTPVVARRHFKNLSPDNVIAAAVRQALLLLKKVCERRAPAPKQKSNSSKKRR
jgi:nicotinamide-nucleotide amidase